MKRVSLYLSALLALVSSLFADTPPITFSLDIDQPQPFTFTTYAGNTPKIIVSILTNGVAYTSLGTGWAPYLNYALNNAASSIHTNMDGTIDPSTGILTFTGKTNSFPVAGTFFAEVYLQNGNTKLTCGQGSIIVNKSPSSGSYGSLNLKPRINWDIIDNIGTIPWASFSTNYLYSIIVANATAQANSNLWYLSAIGALQATNTGYESRITAEEAKSTAQANTNAGFLTRFNAIGSFTNAQIATNLSLLTMLNAYSTAYDSRINWASNNIITLSNATYNYIGTSYTNLYNMDGTITTNLGIASNALRIAIGANTTNFNVADGGLQTNINTVSNYFTNWVSVIATNQTGTTNYFNGRITGITNNMQIQSNALAAAIAGVSAGGLYRYTAFTTTGVEVAVLATSSSFEFTFAGGLFTATIPSGARIISMKIRIDGASTDAGKVYLSMGTNDVPNNSITTDWCPSVNCYNEATSTFVSTITARPRPTNATQIQIDGIPTTAGNVFSLHIVW